MGRYRLYSLSPDGYNQGREHLNNLVTPAQTYFRQAAIWVRSLSFDQLVAAIYRAYPDMRVKSIFRA
jgi:hypothetical protein